MGIGRAIAKGLGAEGVTVVAVRAPRRAARDLGARDGRCRRAAPDRVRGRHHGGRRAGADPRRGARGARHVDILVNCAGGRPAAAGRRARGALGRRRSPSTSPGSARSPMRSCRA
ncbi:MAG: hypothetical protein WDO24_00240 [Pseudomonadota bacterium]